MYSGQRERRLQYNGSIAIFCLSVQLLRLLEFKTPEGFQSLVTSPGYKSSKSTNCTREDQATIHAHRNFRYSGCLFLFRSSTFYWPAIGIAG